MARYPDLSIPENGRLSHNIAYFARALRRAGLPIGPAWVLEAIRAVEVAGFSSRQDFYWVLQACFVSRPEERTVFRQVFRLFWRDPRFLEHMMALLLPTVRGVAPERIAQAAEKRAAEALLGGTLREETTPPGLPTGEVEVEIGAARTSSARERLRNLDFEQMSVAEMAEAKRMIACLALPMKPLSTRRFTPAPSGLRADPRATLRTSIRHGGEIRAIARQSPRRRWPDLVVLCDISGSMSQYSRMVLHFLHALANARGMNPVRVHGFTFGTRLTNITRHLARRDVDQALAAAGAQAQDWSGGTRIGACLAAFNRDWSRRVLGRGAVVVLITDGLDRGDAVELARQMERLHLSCRRLLWLNPLLRWDGFAPRAAGIRAMLPHVDSLRAGHNIASLEALGRTLSDPDDRGDRQRLLRMLRDA